MAVNLVLTDDEASYINDILELWIDGHEEATQEVVDDRSLDTAEDYLQAVEGMHEQYEVALMVKLRLGIARKDASGDHRLTC